LAGAGRAGSSGYWQNPFGDQAPAWVRNARHDMLAANRLARALYAPVLADPRRPANNARFTYLDPAAREFFADWERAADDIAAMLRSEAGSNRTTSSSSS
jgi:MmyB-like transcription regulator ligand binding domain